MIYSLSEIDANCRKAARGSGLSWGYAEEAGKAARWLAAHQLPGAALLADYLTLRQKHPENYQGEDLRCPLVAGAQLCDGGYDAAKQSIVLESVVYPLLLLPYLAQLSQATRASLRLRWSGTNISCHDGALYIIENESISNTGPVQVSCEWLGNDSISLSESTVQQQGTVGQNIEQDHWRALEALAHHTYVPATEASRLGAGPS